jgi:hypothetical protein
MSVTTETAIESDPFFSLTGYRVEVLDYIPVVSIVSGVARSIFGFLQMGYSFGKEMVSIFTDPLGKHTNDILILYGHGKANVIRGGFVMTPIFGNILIYLYDHSEMKKNCNYKNLALY